MVKNAIVFFVCFIIIKICRVFCFKVSGYRNFSISTSSELFPSGFSVFQKEGDCIVNLKLSVENNVVASCRVWWGEENRRQRGYFDLKDSEAELSFLLVDPSSRKKGYAALLLNDSVLVSNSLGIKILYARVWYSNKYSINLFRKLGWQDRGIRLSVE